MRVTAKPVPNKPGFRCTFRHPASQKISSFGLGTQDKTEADAICLDVATIFDDKSDPPLLSDVKSPRLLAYKPRAVDIVFGAGTFERLLKRENKPVLDDADVGTLSGRIATVLGIRADAEKIRRLDNVFAEYESKRYSVLQKQFQQLENVVKVLKPRNEWLETELERAHRARNEHVKVTIGVAVEEWKKAYVQGRASVTYKKGVQSVESFRDSLDRKSDFKLARIRSREIDDWLASLESIGPVTKRNYRAYLSSFFSWALRKYDLAENPIDRTTPLAGVARNPEHIVAIRRLHDLQAFIDSLEPYPYWQAWCAVACFAGPRYSEQAWLKLDDVYLDDGYIRIASRASGKRIIGTKTGRERNIPIEQTVLKDILAAHLKRRQAERKLKLGTTAQLSHWLFPSAVPENKNRPREKSEPGMWSHGRCFLSAWQQTVRKAAKFDAGELKGDAEETAFRVWLESQPAYWSFGPSEWRHTYGTILGQCGWSSLEISRAMGNSPAIAERHYIAVGKGGHRWPFKF